MKVRKSPAEQGRGRTWGRHSPHDRALHARVCAGDGAAVRAMWDRYAPLVRGLLRRVFAPDDEVEDAVHDVFVRLLENVGHVREGGALRSYIVAIALNTARSEMRRRRARRLLGLSTSGADTRRASQRVTQAPVDLVARVAVARLLRILEAIPGEERRVLVLRYVEEMDLAEVAEVSGVSLATVKRRLTKAGDRIVARAKRDPILNEYLDERAPLEPPPG